MAWSPPMTAVAGTVFTASQYNRYIRDNLLETAVAKATQADQYFVVNGVNSIAARKVDGGHISTGQDSTSDSYGDLSTPGPTVTLETGERVLIMLSAAMEPRSQNNMSGAMSVQVSGATSISPSDTHSVMLDVIVTGSGNVRFGATHMIDNLNPGTNVFQAKYRSSGGGHTFRFYRRSLVVVPL
jgi:hypothetical protein